MAGPPHRARVVSGWIAVVLGTLVLGFMAVQYLFLAIVGGLLMPDAGILLWLEGFARALLSAPGVGAILLLLLGVGLLLSARR
jgi:hypothetical protein